MISSESNITLKKIHNYELKNEICEIPCGKIYLGINKYINEKVYIKIYDKYKLFTSFKETSFINNEIFILKLLNHKNILQLYEFIESEKLIFIVFEYFKGETLQKYFTKRKKINETLSLKIIYEIIKAMNYLHSMNICHLNLNFENILIDENNNIKIINFQNGCFYKDNIKKDIIQSNNIFSCPEIHARHSFSPEKADVYSCGIILYYFLMGYFPFNSEKEMIKEELIMKGKYTIPNNIQKNIKNIISGMLEYDSEKRIKFKDIINCEWFKSNKNIINDSTINQGINILTQKYPIDNNVLKICNNFSINNSEISKNSEDNKFTKDMSIYKQLVAYLKSKKIPTTNDYISDKFQKYINNKQNYYAETKQNELIDKYMNDEQEKNKKMKEIENNFYSNGFKVLEELKQIRNKLIEQKYIVNDPDKKNKAEKDKLNNLNNKTTGKHIKFSSLKSEKKNKPNNNAKKVTIKDENDKNPSSKNLPREKKPSLYNKKPKDKNDMFIPPRKRIFTVRMKNPPNKRNIDNDLEESNKNSFVNTSYKSNRRASFSEKNKNILKDNILNKSVGNKQKKLNESREIRNYDKDD
jgi:serine/threonine protein kinase